MATTQFRTAPVTDPGDSETPVSATGDRAHEFDALVQQWRRETAMLSSTERKAMHPAYQRIIGMGQDAIPLVLNEMQRQPGHWFWALRAISGADPVPAEHIGNVAAMTDDWLGWGREHRYL